MVLPHVYPNSRLTAAVDTPSAPSPLASLCTETPAERLHGTGGRLHDAAEAGRYLTFAQLHGGTSMATLDRGRAKASGG